MKKFFALGIAVLMIVSMMGLNVKAYPSWLNSWTYIHYKVEGSVLVGNITITINGTIKYDVIQSTTDNVYLKITKNISMSPENVTELLDLGFYTQEMEIWVNKYTREYVLDRHTYKTDLWIDTNIKFGDTVKIGEIDYQVQADNLIIRTYYEKMAKVVVFKLVYEYSNVKGEQITVVAYYDKIYGLLIGYNVSVGERGWMGIRLAQTNVGEVETVVNWIFLEWIIAFTIGLVVILIMRSKKELQRHLGQKIST